MAEKTKFKNNFAYDLEVGRVAERRIAQIFEGSKIEVKRDLKALFTGNIFIEFECRGKPSGIFTTQSEYYAFDLGKIILFVFTKALRIEVDKYIELGRTVSGGDNKVAKGVLIPLNTVFNIIQPNNKK